MKVLDIKWLQQYAEQEKRYKWGKQIKILLTAYEKEKGENVKLRLQDIPLIEGELKAYKDRVNELKQELEKEKEKNKELEKQLQSTYQKQYINDLEAINHSNVSFN